MMYNRKKYEFMLQAANGEINYRSCLVADVKNLIKILRKNGYRVIGCQKITWREDV
jgi:uncharacterized protein YegP (UPF0339 family)